MILGRLTRYVDAIVVLATFWLLFDSRIWMLSDVRTAELIVVTSVNYLTASAFRFDRSWRLVRLRYEVVDLTVFAILVFLGTMIMLDLLGHLPAAMAARWWPVAAAWFGGMVLCLLFLRILIRLSLRYVRAFGFDRRTAAFVGATATAHDLTRTFQTHPWMGITVLGVFDFDPSPAETSGVGRIADLVDLARDAQVNHIYITLPMEEEAKVRTVVDMLGDTTASIYYCPSMQGFDLIGGRWDEVFGQPVISIVETPFHGYSGALKRLEDLLLLSLILPLMAIPLLVAAVLVRLSSPGAVIYRQRRYGLDGKPFTIFKFRTMYEAEGDGAFVQAQRGDARITPVGRFLRRSSIDELPQLFNVLNGTMSIVGPRPHPVKLNNDYRSVVRRYMVRHKIRPGITGLAQVNGARGETDTLDKMVARVEHDLQYIRSWSVALDVRILLRTLILPFVDKNAY